MSAPLDFSDAAAVKAEAERRQRLRSKGLPLSHPFVNFTAGSDNGSTAHVVLVADPDLPMRVTLPWSYLVPDNEKYGVLKGKMLLRKPYREAKAKIRKLAKEQIGERMPFAQPVGLTATVYVPNTRTRDIANFCKLVHDALEGVCYTNDAWIDSVSWIRMGVDIDRPRVEIAVRHLKVPAASP